MGEGYGRMTDTGKLPEGHQPEPDDAAGGHPSAPAAAQPEAAVPAEVPAGAAAEGAADDDDFLFLPGAQGAWTDPRVPAPAGARSAAPAGGTEPATGAQRRPLHMGPPVPEQAGGVVRSLADRGPDSGSVDTREAVAAADAAGATAGGGAAQTGNAGGTGAGSPAPAPAAGPEAATAQATGETPQPGATAPGAGQHAAAAANSATGSAQTDPDAAAGADTAAGPDIAPGSGQGVPAGAPEGAVTDQAVPAPDGAGRDATGAGAAVPEQSVPAAAGSVPPQATAAGQAPQPPVRTPGPPTVGPEYLDVTQVGPPRLPGPQLGEIPPAPAGWTSVSHPAGGDTVAQAQPPDAGGEGTAAVPEPATARDGATVAAPAHSTPGTDAATGEAVNGQAVNGEPAAAAQVADTAAEQGTGGTPAPAPVDAAQAAVRRAAAAAGASLGRGISAAGGSATQPGDPNGSAGTQPADAAATHARPVNGTVAHAKAVQAAPGGQPAATAATGAGGQADGAAPAPAATPAPDTAPGARPVNGAAAGPGAAPGGPEDRTGGGTRGAGPAERPAPHAVRDGQLAAAAAVSGGPEGLAGVQAPGAGSANGIVPQPAAPHGAGGAEGQAPGGDATGSEQRSVRAGRSRNDAVARPAATAAVPTGAEGSGEGRMSVGHTANGGGAHAAPGGSAGSRVPGGQPAAGAVSHDVPAPQDGSATRARPADEAALQAVPGDGSAARTEDDGVAPTGPHAPGGPAPDRGNTPDRPAGQDAAAAQHADGAVLHAVANGQPVNGARARAANGQAVPGAQPAVPAARAASDEAAPAGAVHAATGGRRGVSLGVQNGAQATPSGTAGESAAGSSAEARPAGDNAPRAGAPVTQIRGRRRRGTAVSAPVDAADAGGDAQAQDAAAAPAAPVPAQASAAPAPANEAPGTPADAAGTPAADPAPAAAAAAPTAAPDTPADAPGTPDAAPGFADAERAAVHRVMRERRDIRNGFRSDPVPHEVLLRVLEAAHTAPSVGHSQPWDFVVIRSEETRHRMHELARRQREAYAKSLPKGRAKQFKELKVEAIRDTPVNIVVTADPTRGGRHTLDRHTQPQMAPYSSALAVENLWLAARAEGLGVGWVSFFDERELVRELDLPEHLDVVAYLCVGYVDEFPDEPELVQAGWSKRRPLSWVVHEESYGRRALPGEDPHDLLAETLEGIRPLDAKALGEAWERQKRMTKPAGSLGMLEIISAQLCGLSRKCPPPVPEPAAVAVFAGDHGVHAQGVTPWPQEVTGQMVANFLGAGAVCNAFAAQVGAEVCVVDAGVAAELPATAGLVPRKVRKGTADMTAGPAMTREEALRAVEVGIETARDLVAAGNKALLTGEMGIANTTASAAIIAVFTDSEAAEVTGRGTGVDDETYARKVEAVRRAIEVNRPDPSDPIGVLAAVGGLEHAALVGFILAGSSLRTPVVLDGVSAGAAALVARAVAPEALAACIAGHRSPEPGHAAALTKLGLRPLIDLDLRLGEGTGALLALPLVQSAARAMHEVATFDAAGVTEKG
ncbi:nicotinate-nucleotide--dimethylbenzimidazole phosphoribosyltransferase [Streptomyces sp. MAR4 CNY-716]